MFFLGRAMMALFGAKSDFCFVHHPLDLCGLRPLDTERGESCVYSR